MDYTYPKGKIMFRGLSYVRVLLPGLVLVAITAIPACISSDLERDTSELQNNPGPQYALSQVLASTIEVTSLTLDEKGYLDQNNTCEGDDTSPHLSWSSPPNGTKSIVILVEDPHHEKTGDIWTHWIVYGLDPSMVSIDSGMASGTHLTVNGVHGSNDWKAQRYNGPCPTPTITYANQGAKFFPPKVARPRPYTFYVYAIDIDTNLKPGADRNTVLKAIDGHILDFGKLDATYRSRKRERVIYSGDGPGA